MITWSRWQVTAKVIFPAVTRLFVRSRTQTYDIEGQVFLHIYSAPVQNIRSLDLHSQLIVFHFQLTTPTPISLVKTFFPYPVFPIPVCQDSDLWQWKTRLLPYSIVKKESEYQGISLWKKIISHEYLLKDIQMYFPAFQLFFPLTSL